MTFLQNKPSLRNGLIVYIITFSLAALVSIYRAITGKDFMDKTVFTCQSLYNITGEYKCISWWPLSHFIMYVVLGTVAPTYWPLWFILGIGWELLEWGVGKLISTTSPNKVNKIYPTRVQYGENWVAGSVTDVIVNGAGLGIGILLSRMMCCKKKKQESCKEKPYKVVYYSEKVQASEKDPENRASGSHPGPS